MTCSISLSDADLLLREKEKEIKNYLCSTISELEQALERDVEIGIVQQDIYRIDKKKKNTLITEVSLLAEL